MTLALEPDPAPLSDRAPLGAESLRRGRSVAEQVALRHDVLDQITVAAGRARRADGEEEAAGRRVLKDHAAVS